MRFDCQKLLKSSPKLTDWIRPKVKHTQPYNNTVCNCKNSLHESLFDYEQLWPEARCALRIVHTLTQPGLSDRNNNKEIKYTQPKIVQVTKLQKQAAALRICLAVSKESISKFLKGN